MRNAYQLHAEGISYMYLHVILLMLAPSEVFCTNLTCEWVFTSVCLHVTLQMMVLTETLFTNFTH